MSDAHEAAGPWTRAIRSSASCAEKRTMEKA
ncbi:hypothetical protein FHS38_000049 [Streptomyces netropsis]|uniref:Uncharacterized protein n=1 Tax=Streptomyces netropsis TaxID=55404 RepID=A0A7W7L5G7_STRNE|nr:hypothetical protein [Streptomyces netropsis]